MQKYQEINHERAAVNTSPPGKSSKKPEVGGEIEKFDPPAVTGGDQDETKDSVTFQISVCGHSQLDYFRLSLTGSLGCSILKTST